MQNHRMAEPVLYPKKLDNIAGMIIWSNHWEIWWNKTQVMPPSKEDTDVGKPRGYWGQQAKLSLFSDLDLFAFTDILKHFGQEIIK